MALIAVQIFIGLIIGVFYGVLCAGLSFRLMSWFWPAIAWFIGLLIAAGVDRLFPGMEIVELTYLIVSVGIIAFTTIMSFRNMMERNLGRLD